MLTACIASCTDSSGSYTCGCPAGTTLDIDGKTCIGRAKAFHLLTCMVLKVSFIYRFVSLLIGFPDEDECATGADLCNCGGLIGCAPSCSNTPGSYDCGCSSGFGLDLDDITCIGK